MTLAQLSPKAASHPSLPSAAHHPTSIESLVLRTQMEDVLARAKARLRACPYREVRRTTCLFNKGVLLLQGGVSSFYLKQIAQTVLMDLEGVRRIVNMIQVRAADQTSAANQS